MDTLPGERHSRPIAVTLADFAPSHSPLLTGHNELMLAEFKYGGIPKETFAPILGSQDKPSVLFYYLKKDFFPTAYWNAFVKVGRCSSSRLSSLLTHLRLRRASGSALAPSSVLSPT